MVVADVVDVHCWNEAVSELRGCADKWNALFNLTMFPSGKERIVVELWFNPKGEVKNGTKS
jgi:hypothetical protein